MYTSKVQNYYKEIDKNKNHNLHENVNVERNFKQQQKLQK